MIRRVLLSALLLILTLFLGYGVARSEFEILITAYGAFFALYLWVVYKEQGSNEWYLHLGLLLRVLLLFSLPNLSDDFYRFLWDGRLLAAGYHPFAHTPEYYIQEGILPPGITPELYGKLNSPQYYTVYPPVAQAVFGLAGVLSPGSLWGGVLIIKLFLLGCEWGTIRILQKQFAKAYLAPPGFVHLPATFSRFTKLSKFSRFTKLSKFSKPTKPALLYALNPLAILEVVGNCHFEGAMIFFLLLGLYTLDKGNRISAPLWLALATASKLLPVLFLPVIWRKTGFYKGLVWMLLFGAFSLALFLPLLQPEIVRHIGASLNLYFRQFAFNASVYYVLKATILPFAPPAMDVGRTLGPILGIITATVVLGLAFLKIRTVSDTIQVRQALTLAATVYLLNATTVHPWYILVPFALSLGTGWRYPLVWTGVVFLSYSHYAGGGFQEYYRLIGIEYLILIMAMAGDWYRLGNMSHANQGLNK